MGAEPSMLEQFFQFLLDCLGSLRFWVVIEPYEEGVRLRLGKFVDELKPGFHWMWPLHIDHVIIHIVVATTHHLGFGSITTRDGKAVGFNAVITHKVHDIKKAMLEIENVEDAIRDACSGEIGRVLHGSTWEEITDDSILDKLTSACRKRGFRYGIEILSVQLSSLSLVKNIRLMGST